MGSVNLSVNPAINPTLSKDLRLIAVYPASTYVNNLRLLEALQDIYSVRFIACSAEDLITFQYALLLEATEAQISTVQQYGLRCFVCPDGVRQELESVSDDVRFANHKEIDKSFRVSTFYETTINEACQLNCQADDIVLAEKGGLPIWLRRSCGTSVMDLVAVKPKKVAANEILREHFNRHCFTHILPLLHFVREVAEENSADYTEPYCACIVIDDPSLYHPSYGCINFRKLGKHAQQHGYHVAIATIPLDTWKISSRVASIFRDFSSNLSLIMHGNSHTSLELAGSRSPSHLLAIAAQALRRFKRCETDGRQLVYSPIMEAPYGTFVSELAEPLVNLGYKASLCTPSQFIRHNREHTFAPAFGCGRADALPHGLCAIPRLVMSDDWRIEVAIAAFLRQPIVLACHHNDFFEGMELLAEFATYINRLGQVKWSSLAEIAESNYTTAWDLSTLTIKLGARQIVCSIPSGVKQIVIKRPWIHEGNERLILNDGSKNGKPLELMTGMLSDAISWDGDKHPVLVIESPSSNPVAPNSVAATGALLWPIARKLMFETRDRLYPLAPPAVIRYLRKRKHKLNFVPTKNLQTNTRNQAERKNYAGS